MSGRMQNASEGDVHQRGSFSASRLSLAAGSRLRLDVVDWAVFGFLVVGLAWIPLPLGSNRLLPWGINAVLFGSLLVVYELGILLRGRQHPVGIKIILPSALSFGLVAAWIMLQASTQMPVGAVHPIYQMVADALGVDVAASVSVDRDATTLALLRFLTAGSLFWLCLQLCRDSERAHLLLSAIGTIAAGYAAFGFLDMALGGTMLGFESTSGGFFIRSTFVNKNTFATFAGLGLVANVGLLMRHFRHAARSAGRSTANRIVALIETSAREAPYRLGATLLLLAAVLLTASRAGIMSSIVGLLSLGLLNWHSHRKRGSEPVEMLVFITFVAAGCYLFFGDLFVGRLATGGLFDEARKSVFSITLQSILDAPVTGFGDGTFRDVFAMYRDRSISIVEGWDKAHDTYLEVLQGLGVVAGSLLFACLGFLFVRCAFGFMQRRRDVTPSAVALAATALVATHALVDFSLQIQGVGLTYVALLGTGVAQSISSRRATTD